MTSVWSTRAKGLYVEDKNGVITPEELSGMDFLIAKTGDTFTDQVQAAYDCNPKMPIILFYDNNPELYLDMGLDEARWPSADNDPQIAYLDNMLGYNKETHKIFRSIHGIMLNCSKVKHQGDKSFTAPWIKRHGQHMKNMIWNRYGLSNYLYIDSNPWTIWKQNAEAIETLNSFVKDEISTVSIAKEFDGILPATGQTIKLPADSAHWYFWLYGIATKGLRMLYNGSKEVLYKELGFVSSVSTGGNTETNEENSGGEITANNEDITYIKDIVNKNNVLLGQISNNLENLMKHFKNV